MIHFFVSGNPIPKQSFRYAKGGGYTPDHVKAWQANVAVRAKEAMQGESPICQPVKVTIIFTLPDRRVKDLDNLSKGTLDGMRKIIFKDDAQVMELNLRKRYEGEPGAFVHVEFC
jgi:Holliday junction resolvase RusA-like endonuclease